MEKDGRGWIPALAAMDASAAPSTGLSGGEGLCADRDSAER